MLNIRSVLVPLDQSEISMEAVDAALDVARAKGARLHVLQVLEPPAVMQPYATMGLVQRAKAETGGQVEDQLGELMRRCGATDFVVAVRVGSPAAEILTYADEAHIDLIVMATHGRSGLARMMLGSTTEHVLRRTPCPVLVVRPGALTSTRHEKAESASAGL